LSSLFISLIRLTFGDNCTASASSLSSLIWLARYLRWLDIVCTRSIRALVFLMSAFDDSRKFWCPPRSQGGGPSVKYTKKNVFMIHSKDIKYWRFDFSSSMVKTLWFHFTQILGRYLQVYMLLRAMREHLTQIYNKFQGYFCHFKKLYILVFTIIVTFFIMT